MHKLPPSQGEHVLTLSVWKFAAAATRFLQKLLYVVGPVKAAQVWELTTNSRSRARLSSSEKTTHHSLTKAASILPFVISSFPISSLDPKKCKQQNFRAQILSQRQVRVQKITHIYILIAQLWEQNVLRLRDKNL